MRIGIYGTGGLGGLIGARLALAGEDVVFIARGEHLRALRAQGLRLEGASGEHVIRPVAATDDPAEAGVCDVVLVTTKTWQVPEAARAMGPMLGPRTVVVPLVNGVEAPDQLAEVLGRERVAGGLARVIALRAGPGVIRHVGMEPACAVGELDHRRTERMERLRAALERAGIRTEIPDDIHAALWAKFLFVVGWGAVGAVTRAPVGVLRALPETRALLAQAMAEIEAVARARRIALPEDITPRTLAALDTLPPEGTASLQRDIAEGRPSELEAWSGAVVRLGAEVGVPTPVHGFIHTALLPAERRARGEIAFPG
ncbi:2-dehydropantoate 2-reductase [Inmirania thermothiophila]|uniref:2-dehydropantoate 2-reductase n=1 Tax=Inmirania thermothiophila TaxID=1750597 RepID=A0A3N1Y1P0_9GAMM|nr:2-dehydropantoate 2-reductase [Inmirania thermothiophila]ROR32746.1 ketopantoate reductase [Inmirania thermothiophila]